MGENAKHEKVLRYGEGGALRIKRAVEITTVPSVVVVAPHGVAVGEPFKPVPGWESNEPSLPLSGGGNGSGASGTVGRPRGGLAGGAAVADGAAPGAQPAGDGGGAG